MCVYSLEHEAEDARKGDRAVIHNFGPNRGKWLKATSLMGNVEPGCPLCVKDGTTLLLCKIPSRWRQTMELEESAKAHVIEGIENETDDELIFHNGQKVKIKDLPLGVEIEVLALERLPIEPELSIADDIIAGMNAEMPSGIRKGAVAVLVALILMLILPFAAYAL